MSLKQEFMQALKPLCKPYPGIKKFLAEIKRQKINNDDYLAVILKTTRIAMSVPGFVKANESTLGQLIKHCAERIEVTEEPRNTPAKKNKR